MPAEHVSSTDAALDLGDIVVTAQKRRQSIDDVGLSITALTGDALAQRGITSVADLERVVPGLTFTQSPFNQPIYTLRGIGYSESSLAAAPAVSVYVDEIPLAFSSMTEGVLLDVQRVEVLKGPQGTLYGQNSTGGAINFVAAKPTDSFNAGADLGFARFNSADIGGFVSGPINDTLRARFAVRTIQGGDWQQSHVRDDTLGKTDQVIGRLLLDWTPTDRLRVTINLNGWHDSSDTLGGQVIAITPSVPSNFPGGVTLSRLTPRVADWTHGWPGRDDTFYESSIRADYGLSDRMKLTSISSYQHLDEDKRSDLDANFLIATNYRQFGKIDSFTQELRLSGESRLLNWMAGANYARADIPDSLVGEIRDLSLTKPIPSLPAFPEVATRTRTRINSYAGFGNLEYGLTDHLTLIGGLRYTQTNRRFAGCTYASTPQFAAVFNAIQADLVQAGVKTTPIIPIGVGDCSNLDASFSPVLNRNRLKQNNLSFRAGANYKTDAGTLLYASVSRGYKGGGSPVIPSSVSAQLHPVTQERLLAYEAGFKAPLFGRRAQLNAAAFYYDYKDKQLRGRVLDSIFFVLERLVNIPKSRVLGGEVELQARPIEGLDLGLSGTYSDTRVLRYQDYNDGGVPLDYRGSPFPYTPKIQLVADAQYAFGLGANRKFFLGAGARRNSRSRTIFVSPASPQPSDSIYRIKAYTLLDLRAGLQDSEGDWRVSIWGRNITNQYYWTNVFNANDVKFRLPARPAEYGISFSIGVGQKLRF